MPELLAEWRRKRSWKSTLPICRIYQSKKTGTRGMSLRRMCSMEPQLTLTKTGFSEIRTLDRTPEVNPDYEYLTHPLPRFTHKKPADIAKLLIKKMENYLVNNWDSDSPHLMLCSGGLDSRILSWVLAGLRDRRGRDWLGSIHFRCFQPEGPLFKQAMKVQGWHPSEYSVWRPDRFNSPDYFDIGDFTKNGNAFYQPMAEFWSDIVPLEGERDTVLITGSGGGEIFSYPLFRHWQFTENRYSDLVSNTQSIFTSVHRAYHRWADILSPYLGYGYLDTAFRVPRQYFTKVPARCFSTVPPYNRWQWRDRMRMAMLNLFKDDTPLFVGHEYNLRISKKRAAYMKRMYRGSRFYGDYGHLGYVRDAEPWKPYLSGTVSQILKSLDAKLYGYAAMYEGVGRDNP